MRYTRYDYKKKNNFSFIVPILVVIALGCFIGIILFKVAFKNVNGVINNTNGSTVTANTYEDKKNYKFIVIQCGVFQNMDNAKQALSTIPSGFNSFVVQENGVYKVMAGIYAKGEESSKIDELNRASVINYSIKCDVSDGKDSRLESEIIKGYIKIITKLSDNQVKSINTGEFKKWINQVSNGSNNQNVKNLVEKANALPEQCSIDNVNDLMIFVYNILVKYKS